MGGYELFQLLFLVEPELYLVHPSGSKPRQQLSKLRRENGVQGITPVARWFLTRSKDGADSAGGVCVTLAPAPPSSTM